MLLSKKWQNNAVFSFLSFFLQDSVIKKLFLITESYSQSNNNNISDLI